MKEILIDTSVLIDFLERNLTDPAKTLLASHPTSISVITYYEACRHFLKIGKAKELEFLKQKLRGYKTHSITLEICGEAANIAHSHRLSTADSLILATARINGLSLATRDSDLKSQPEAIFLKPRK